MAPRALVCARFSGPPFTGPLLPNPQASFSFPASTAAAVVRSGAAREWLLDQDAGSGFTVSSLAVSPCGGFVALIGGSRCCVRAWEESSQLGPPLAEWDTGLADDSAVGAFLPGGGRARHLALGNEAGALQVWDLQPGGGGGGGWAAPPRLACSWRFEREAVKAVSAAAAGARGGGGGGALLAAAFSSGAVRVVELAPLPGAGGALAAGAVHTLGGRGAVEQGAKYGQVPTGGGAPRAGSWGACGVAFSPDGRALFVLESSSRGGALLAKWRLMGGLEARASGRAEGAVAPPAPPDAEVWGLSATNTPSRTPLCSMGAFFPPAGAGGAPSGAAALPPRPEARALLALAGGPDGRVLLVDPDALGVAGATPPLFPSGIPVDSLAVAPTSRLLVAGTFISDRGSRSTQASNLRLLPLPGSGAGASGGGGLRLRACVLLALLLFVAAVAWGWLALVRVARNDLEGGGGGGGGPFGAFGALGGDHGEPFPSFQHQQAAPATLEGGDRGADETPHSVLKHKPPAPVEQEGGAAGGGVEL